MLFFVFQLICVEYTVPMATDVEDKVRKAIKQKSGNKKVINEMQKL